MATSWTADHIVTSNEWNDQVTGIQLSLDNPRWVHRISAWGWPTLNGGAGWHAGNSVSIAVQSDDGANWTTIAEHASLTRDAGGLWYWDFNWYHKAKNIRIWLNNKTDDPQVPSQIVNSVDFNEIEVWGLEAGQEPKTPEPNPQGDRFTAFNPGESKWGVNRAQALALQYGIVLPAWIPSEGFARGAFNDVEQQLTGGAFPMFYDQPLFNRTVMNQLGEGTPWALAKAPFGQNGMREAGEPRDFMTGDMKAYAKNLIDIQFGDERNYSPDEVKGFTQWFKWARENVPGAINHANWFDDPTWKRLDRLQPFVQDAQPDLLSWDTYYYGMNGGPKPKDVVNSLYANGTWQAQRQAGLAGITGDGKQPILYGQYLDYNWDANVSESQKAVVPALGLASGQKWFDLFRMEYNGYDRSSIIDQDGAPTRSFYEFTKIFQDIRGVGEYLVALNNQYVALVPGNYSDRGVSPDLSIYHKMGNFGVGDEAKAANEKVGLRNVTVENKGTVNNGMPGDVVIGYFDTLPGLEKAKAEEIFGKFAEENPRGFLVTNALTGDTNYPSYLLNPRTDNGSYRETAQNVTLDVKRPFKNAKLMMVDPETYEPVSIEPEGAGD